MLPDSVAPHFSGMRCLTTMLWVGDLGRSIRFYEEKLGAVVLRRDRTWNIATFRLPGGRDLSVRQDIPGREVARAGLCTPYVVFQSDDPERDREAFIAAGVTVTELQRSEGIRMFWFSDPDGNQFCVLQFIYE